ncbi:MAG: tRNA lysidine(34) synthetase TilS [Pontiellaceae bacterium]|nr:tRNA lysidine(34) synthetase TilS [Pontiellaceae bacterium]MBN2785711.1 tRNA lysidine(34) synthetase TilS [Pontiellaceae bacterium]
MNLTETIHNTICRHNLLPAGSEVVVGVSAGADSTALVHILCELGWPVRLAHLNHQLRGAESDRDEAFIRELAISLRRPLEVRSTDVQALADTSGDSVEMAARRARHDFFASFGRVPIALAHHADDQVETFFLRLARGTGPEGLGGMEYRRTIGSMTLIRPMLDVSRVMIREWLRRNDIEWREDSSNSDSGYLRNRIRHQILPLLEQELNPAIRNGLLRTMKIQRDENAWMNASIAGCRLPDPEWPQAAQRRILRKWLFENGAEEAGFDTVEQILALMAKGEGTTVYELNHRQRVVVEYGIPRFEKSGPATETPSWTLTIEHGTGWKRDHSKGLGIMPAEASIDASRVNNAQISVRSAEPGDRLAPLGIEGTRKLQDIFTDLKVPKAQRSCIPVVVCRGEIIWIPGYRIAREWAVPDGQSHSIHMRIERSEER